MRAVVKYNGNGWQVNLGIEVIGNWVLGCGWEGDVLSAEHAAKMYAARVNAELDGGVLAFGCDKEARRKQHHCVRWCGSTMCVASTRASSENPGGK